MVIITGNWGQGGPGMGPQNQGGGNYGRMRGPWQGGRGGGGNWGNNRGGARKSKS